VTWGFQVTVVLVAVACGNFRACFLGPPGVPLPTGEVEGMQACRAEASAAAASASSDEVAVAWVDVIGRIACCRQAVKDSSSAVTRA
jgi:hypothetical protein